ncbi:MAG: prephenate dehydratase [Bacteroidota bacterium]
MQALTDIESPIAIQGVEGSFHALAARKYFGPDIQLVMSPSFPALFKELDNEQVGFAVVAIENSVAGTLMHNYTLLRKGNHRIIGEVYLRIAHNLMAMPGQSLPEIQEVYSHPMALAQCQMFFERHPHLRLVEAEDTAGSAQWIQEGQRKGVAAVASVEAAEVFGLEILAPEIEDNPRNFTRFFIVETNGAGKGDISHASKASLCFNLLHQVGSLAGILQTLAVHELNLTKIQSLPIIGQEWEYFFHLDIEFDALSAFQEALTQIQPQVNELKVLGAYPRGVKL